MLYLNSCLLYGCWQFLWQSRCIWTLNFKSKVSFVMIKQNENHKLFHFFQKYCIYGFFYKKQWLNTKSTKNNADKEGNRTRYMYLQTSNQIYFCGFRAFVSTYILLTRKIKKEKQLKISIYRLVWYEILFWQI